MLSTECRRFSPHFFWRSTCTRCRRQLGDHVPASDTEEASPTSPKPDGLAFAFPGYCRFKRHLWRRDTCRACGNAEAWHADTQMRLLIASQPVNFDALRDARVDAGDDMAMRQGVRTTAATALASASATIMTRAVSEAPQAPRAVRAIGSVSAVHTGGNATRAATLPNLVADEKVSCCVCGDAIPYETEHDFFYCETAASHSMCYLCFGDLVLHACENFMHDGKFPITCPAPSCTKMISDVQIRNILEKDGNRGASVWYVYQSFQLKAGLIGFSDLVPITCNSCGVYSELFPQDYQRRSRATRNHLMGAEDMGEVLESVGEERTKDAAAIATATDATRQPVATTIASVQDKTALNPVASLLDLFQEYFMPFLYIPTKEEVAAQAEDANASFLRDMIDKVTADGVKSKKVRFPDSRTVQTKGAETAVQLKARIDMLLAARQDNVEHKEELEHKEAPATASTAMAALALLPPPMKLVRQVSDFSHTFFACRMKDCDYAQCLLCDEQMKESDSVGHECKSSLETDLYHALNNVLAEASARGCPKCKQPGVKDLNCTHVTCAKCKLRWCYVCASAPESFSTHNNPFKIRAPYTPLPDKGICPMYLKYKYGNANFRNGYFNGGSPAECLERFHVETQVRAASRFVHALRAANRKNVLTAFKTMMQKHYPNGIWEMKVLKSVLELEFVSEHLSEYQGFKDGLDAIRVAANALRAAKMALLTAQTATVKHEKRVEELLGSTKTSRQGLQDAVRRVRNAHKDWMDGRLDGPASSPSSIPASPTSPASPIGLATTAAQLMLQGDFSGTSPLDKAVLEAKEAAEAKDDDPEAHAARLERFRALEAYSAAKSDVNKWKQAVREAGKPLREARRELASHISAQRRAEREIETNLALLRTLFGKHGDVEKAVNGFFLGVGVLPELMRKLGAWSANSAAFRVPDEYKALIEGRTEAKSK